MEVRWTKGLNISKKWSEPSQAQQWLKAATTSWRFRGYLKWADRSQTTGINIFAAPPNWLPCWQSQQWCHGLKGLQGVNPLLRVGNNLGCSGRAGDGGTGKLVMPVALFFLLWGEIKAPTNSSRQPSPAQRTEIFPIKKANSKARICSPVPLIARLFPSPINFLWNWEV